MVQSRQDARMTSHAKAKRMHTELTHTLICAGTSQRSRSSLYVVAYYHPVLSGRWKISKQWRIGYVFTYYAVKFHSCRCLHKKRSEIMNRLPEEVVYDRLYIDRKVSYFPHEKWKWQGNCIRELAVSFHRSRNMSVSFKNGFHGTS